jgi:hypothetical protein
MAIQNLVTIAIDDGEKTSNKLKALELIGKMSEVSLFAETKTHVHLHSSQDIKVRLLESLRQAFTSSRSINDLAKRKAESLLIELSEPIDQDETPYPFTIDETATPLHPDPQKLSNTESETLHSIPLNKSHSEANSLLQDLTITPVIVTNPLESDTCASIGKNPNDLDDDSEGVGGINSVQDDGEVLHVTPPVTNSNEKG